MLSEKEIKSLKKYYVRPMLFFPLLIGLLLEVLAGAVPLMIGDVFFHVNFDAIFTVMFAIGAIYVVLFFVTMLSTFLWMNGKEWKGIVEKTNVEIEKMKVSHFGAGFALFGMLLSNSRNKTVKDVGVTLETIGGINMSINLIILIRQMRKNIRTVAEVYGIELPSASVKITVILLLPFFAAFLTAGIGLPLLASSTSETRTNVVEPVLQDIRNAIADAGCTIEENDYDKGAYSTSGYWIEGWLRKDKEKGLNSYLRYHVDNDGKIILAEYRIGIDPEADKDDMISYMKSELDALRKPAEDLKEHFVSSAYVDELYFPEEFLDIFKESEYFDKDIRYYSTSNKVDNIYYEMGYYSQSRTAYENYPNLHIMFRFNTEHN